MNIQLIEDLRKLKKLNQKDFAESIDFTITGYQKMIKSGDLKVSVLEKICEVYDVNISTFFGYKNLQKLSFVAEESEVYQKTDYKQKYFEAVEKLNACNERLINHIDIKKT